VEPLTTGLLLIALSLLQYKMFNWLSERFILPDLKYHQIRLSNNTLTDDDRKRLIKDWLWEIEQELPEISSSSLSPESKDKIKTLLNQIGDIVVIIEEEEKNEEEKKNREGNYL
jgi:hypothetical protein